MNVVVGGLIVVVVTAFAVAAMLLVRRGAPEGSYFADGDRASAVFGVLATGFAVLLGFVVCFAFTLDHPFHRGVGGLRPVAMERTLRVIDEQLATLGVQEVTACDMVGNPS